MCVVVFNVTDVFIGNRSSISRDVGLSVGLSVGVSAGLSICLSVGRSVILSVALSETRFIAVLCCW